VGKRALLARPNSWTKSRQKSEEFSTLPKLLFTVTSTVYSLALRFTFLETLATSCSF
jgi:hypothetical protein